MLSEPTPVYTVCLISFFRIHVAGGYQQTYAVAGKVVLARGISFACTSDISGCGLYARARAYGCDCPVIPIGGQYAAADAEPEMLRPFIMTCCRIPMLYASTVIFSPCRYVGVIADGCFHRSVVGVRRSPCRCWPSQADGCLSRGDAARHIARRLRDGCPPSR